MLRRNEVSANGARPSGTTSAVAGLVSAKRPLPLVSARSKRRVPWPSASVGSRTVPSISPPPVSGDDGRPRNATGVPAVYSLPGSEPGQPRWGLAPVDLDQHGVALAAA